LVHADDINLLCNSINIIKENTETLLEDGRNVGLEINTEKTKYMIMSFIRTPEKLECKDYYWIIWNCSKVQVLGDDIKKS